MSFNSSSYILMLGCRYWINTDIPTSGCNLQSRCCFSFWSISTSTLRPHARLANSWFTTETCSTSRFCFALFLLFIFPYFLFFLLFFFAFSKTFLCKVNFDLFTKLFLVVGVCWLFQVGFSFLEEKKYSYIPSIWTFSSDSCLVGHISFGVHWEDLHFAAGIIVKFITAILWRQICWYWIWWLCSRARSYLSWRCVGPELLFSSSATFVRCLCCRLHHEHPLLLIQQCFCCVVQLLFSAQDSCCVPCCRGGGDFIELPAEELSTIDRFSTSFSLSRLTGNLKT